MIILFIVIKTNLSKVLSNLMASLKSLLEDGFVMMNVRQMLEIGLFQYTNVAISTQCAGRP